jgi:hypothetical protein
LCHFCSFKKFGYRNTETLTKLGSPAAPVLIKTAIAKADVVGAVVADIEQTNEFVGAPAAPHPAQLDTE